MATLADSLVSSASRVLRLRMRPDLTARRHRYHGRTYWVVKEPVGLNYFRFHEEEYAILGMLNGHATMEQIKEQFEAEFPPQKITFQDLQQFIGMLHRSGLVVAEAPGQGQQLKRRRTEKKRREFIGKISNVFALRFRGIDPERLLNWLYPLTGWFFRKLTVMMLITFCLSALMLVLVQFEVFQSRLPTFHQFFGARNWLWLAVVMGVVKVLHEFGHGLSCKHFGGECHEMGAMLLVFTPALYCNVSDSWMLPNKWHRVAIGAAGMYVELVLASIATYLWWFSDPSTLLNQLSLRVMFICSVSTVAFNGNPLLRFDGYYILMDISEIPNLRQKATEVLKRFMIQLCLGIEQPENPFLPQKYRFLFGLYTVAAVAYRWVVVFGIVWFLNKVLEPYGLKVIGIMLAFTGFFGLVGQPTWQLGKFFFTPGRIQKVKRHRVFATAAVAVAIIAFVVFVPLPSWVSCPMTIENRGATPLYARVDSRIVEVKTAAGKQVAEGDVLALLDSVELRGKIAELEGKMRDAEIRQESLQSQQSVDENAAALLGIVEAEINTLNHDLKVMREELGRLTVKAPTDGTVLLPPYREKKSGGNGQAEGWSGYPFDEKNVGARLSPQDVICLIGDPGKLEAVLALDQSDVQLVQAGDEASFMLEVSPGKVYHGKIERIAPQEMKSAPLNMSNQAGGNLGTQMDKSGVPRPISTSYRARVTIDEADDPILRNGLRGKAKVYTVWQPLGTRIVRGIAKIFRFEL